MSTHTSLSSTLKALGFENEEILIFISLIENGANNVASIAKKTKLSRTTVYRNLERLIKKKRVSVITKTKRTLYEAVDPSTFVGELEEITKQGAKDLYHLSKKHQSSFFIPLISVYDGQTEIHKIYEDIIQTLPKGGTYFRYTSRNDSYEKTPLYQLHKEQKEIERLVITNLQKAGLKEKSANRFIKTVPKDFAFDDNVILLIYGQKVAYIDYNSMTGTVIESPQLARFQEKIFKLLWRKL